MRRTQLLTTILAMIAIGSACANESVDAETDAVAPQELGVVADSEAVAEPGFGVTLSCGLSGGAFSLNRAGCYASRRVLTLANFEVALAVDAQASFRSDAPGYVGGFLDMTYYGPDWSVFAELSLPNLVPPVGTGDLWRVGFTARF